VHFVDVHDNNLLVVFDPVNDLFSIDPFHSNSKEYIFIYFYFQPTSNPEWFEFL